MDVQQPDEDVASLPPYPSPGSASNDALPAYQPTAPGSQSHSSATPFEFVAARDSPSHSAAAPGATTVVPYCLLPSVMNANGTWGLRSLTDFYICGATPADRLFRVHMHVSGNGREPLGERTGCLLHNGLTGQDPIVAAAGENLDGQLRFRWDYLNTSSVIMVSNAAGPKGFRTEVMSGLTTSQGEVVFRFGMDVGTAEKTRREEFEWVKFGKGDDKEDQSVKGYKLFGCVNKPELEGEAGAGSSSGAGETTHRGTEALAVLTWPQRLLAFMVSHDQFTLKLTEASQAGGLGEPWKLMVLITALRLGYLRAQGTTNKTVVRHSADKA